MKSDAHGVATRICLAYSFTVCVNIDAKTDVCDTSVNDCQQSIERENLVGNIMKYETIRFVLPLTVDYETVENWHIHHRRNYAYVIWSSIP